MRLTLLLLLSAITAQADTNSLQIFTALCSAIESNYPMLEFVGWRGEEWKQEFQAKIERSTNAQAAFELMDELVCRLNDYHTRFSWPDKPRLESPPFRVEPVLAESANAAWAGIWGAMRPPVHMPAIEPLLIAVTRAAPGCGVQPGDEIVAVDGVPIREALARSWPHAVGCSVAGKLRSAAGHMLQRPRAQPLNITVRRAERSGKSQLITMSVTQTALPGEPVISSRESDGVTVIRISRWSDSDGDLVDHFDGILNKLRDRPGIIFDVRRNGGGQDRLADEVVGRFIKQPVISSISLPRQVPGMTFQRKVLRALPRGPWQYEGRVAVLVDEGCMSACEHFVSGMVEAGALLCGTPTSGACGLIRTVNLPGGARLNVSQTFPIHTGGIPSPQLGIAPHLWAPPLLPDLQSGKDTALLAALEWIKSGKPLPVRLQPAAPIGPISK